VIQDYFDEIDQQVKKLIDDQGTDIALVKLFHEAQKAERSLHFIRRVAIALMSKQGQESNTDHDRSCYENTHH